jgi:hypothetical protein
MYQNFWPKRRKRAKNELQTRAKLVRMWWNDGRGECHVKKQNSRSEKDPELIHLIKIKAKRDYG